MRFQLQPPIAEQAIKLIESAAENATRGAECLASARDRIGFAGSITAEIATDLTDAALSLQRAAHGLLNAQNIVSSAASASMVERMQQKIAIQEPHKDFAVRN